jgi:hypothetical protein
MTDIDVRSMNMEELRAYHKAQERCYNIVRLYFKGGKRLIQARVTLAEAQAHCSDPETSSATCTHAAGRRRTRIMGLWFDAYEVR